MTDRKWMVTARFTRLQSEAAGGACERYALDRGERLRMAAFAVRLSAGLDGASLFLCLARCRLFDAINMARVMTLWEIDGRDASSSAGIVDS